MTVSATTPLVVFTYTGTGEYPFDFQVFEESDIQCIYEDGMGIATLLTQSSDYYVTLVDGVDGGTVTVINTDLAIEGTLTVQRKLPLTQEVDWVNNDPLDAETLEDSFDRIVMILQQQETYINEVLVESFSYKGDWQANTYYQKFNVVTYGGNYYTARDTFTSGTTFVAANWNLVFDFSDLYDLVAQAAQSEANAADSAAEAATSESNAKTSEQLAAASEANSAISENNAANCAAEANASAVDAADSAAQAASGIRTDAIIQDYFTATAGQTTFTLSQAPAADNAVIVYMNSRKLRLTEDYTVSGQTVVLNEGAAVGDEIDVVNFNLSVLVVP